MTIVKSELGKIFGGYTDISWGNFGTWIRGKGNSFIFSLRDNSTFVFLRCRNKNKEVFHKPNILCNFGGNEGFALWDDCNIDDWGFQSNLGDCDVYEQP